MLKDQVRPIRSLVFVPGDDAGALDASRSCGADAVVVDLEEPREPFSDAQRRDAGRLVGEFLRSLPLDGGRPAYFVRVRSPRTGLMFRDLQPVLCPALTGVLTPKLEDGRDVVAADAIVTAAEVENEVVVGSTALYPILETAAALRNAYDIAVASPRVAYMGGAISRFGDIHQSVGYRWTAEGTETLFIRSKVLVDCRAGGIKYPISGMWGGANDDLDGLRRFATELRDLGYFGMMLNTAEHAEVVHEVFSPTAEEVRYWADLDRLATEAAATPDAGPITYGDPNDGEGHVVHGAHVASARKNLAWARELGLSP
jgi:citrate lyase subunit beta / citryl-CoA lyase